MFNLRALKFFTAIAVVATSVFAQDHSSESSEAQITGTHYSRSLRPLSLFANFSYKDPNTECTVYSYPPVAQNINNFPTIWQPATLLASDTNGQALWQKIASGVPNIAPKGQLNGSTINETYDLVNDPDCCEWRFSSSREERGDRQSPNPDSCFPGHATGARPWWLGIPRSHAFTPPPLSRMS